MLLKISGIYKAALNAETLTENEHASRTFQDVVVPILRLVAKQVPPNVDCDDVGFEIAYNTRDANQAYDYEGKEVLSVVFSREDAFAYTKATGDAERQAILNRSEIFVDGKDFGLALGQRDPLNVEALERSVPRQSRQPSSAIAASSFPVAATTPGMEPAPTSADAEQLQARLQQQLNAIVKDDGAKLHFVQGAPPAFEIYNDEILLHFTMQNALPFEKSTSSIYKRAAQSFDLFLAPKLKELLEKLPAGTGTGYEAFDFSVLNRIGDAKTSSETVDYICPFNSVRSFVENKITSQDLINQSIVLVNGVRIGLNLQLVE